MKKAVVSVLCLVLALSMAGCGGDISTANIQKVDSEMYSQEDIASAIDVIMQEFKSGWKGCTLKEIYYAGDESVVSHQEWAERDDADEVIVLLSSFDVDSSGGDGSLNPNSTYDGWNWILIRADGGQWQHMDHGY